GARRQRQAGHDLGAGRLRKPRGGRNAVGRHDGDLDRRSRSGGTAVKAALVAAAMLAAQGAQDAGMAPAARVRITVRAIAATSGTEQTDPKLKPIAKNLSEFSKDFRYRNFQLASEPTFDLAFER